MGKDSSSGENNKSVWSEANGEKTDKNPYHMQSSPMLDMFLQTLEPHQYFEEEDEEQKQQENKEVKVEEKQKVKKEEVKVEDGDIPVKERSWYSVVLER